MINLSLFKEYELALENLQNENSQFEPSLPPPIPSIPPVSNHKKNYSDDDSHNLPYKHQTKKNKNKK
jgi:hypothetical protein